MIIKNTQNVKFSVKSGGHNPNVGYGSVDGGVLVSMSRLASTTLSIDRKTADVGPGARWIEVIGALDPLGVTVVGGHLVVLANGEVLDANASNNTDLFWALKGGGNQFGIVTRFTLKTYPFGKVWGGIRVYNGDQASAIINAVHDFTENFHDPKAAIIVTNAISALSSLNIVDTFVLFFFYDGSVPPTRAFNMFNMIPNIVDGTKTRTYTDLLKATDSVDQYGFRYLIRGTPLPNLPSTTGKTLLKNHHSTWRAYVTVTNLLNLRIGFIFTIAFQPLPFIIPSQSLSIGGPNPLGLKPEVGDLMWMEYDIAWLSSGADSNAYTMAMDITATIDGHVRQTYGGIKNSNSVEGSQVPEQGFEYGPIFMNDAMFDQDPFKSYGSVNYDRLKGIQRHVDQGGFFPKRTGGFKFT